MSLGSAGKMARTSHGLPRVAREDAYRYEMLAGDPILRVRPGEPFVVETEDAFNGAISSGDRVPSPETLDPRPPNPCAGPVHVEGAMPGDVLAVDILDIVPADQGAHCIFPGEGTLARSAAHPECHGPYARIIRHVPGPSGTTSDGYGVFADGVRWPLQPHIGTIGTAPRRPVAAGADTLMGQGRHGGNLDCRDVRRGCTILLPVEVEGACVYLGDVHASMSDGEWVGNADECRAEVTLQCRLLRTRISWPRVETPESIIQLASGKPLEAAIRQAFLWLTDWLVEEQGFSSREAYMQLGVNPGVRIHVYQLVDLGRLGYTVGVAFPRHQLDRQSLEASARPGGAT